MKFYTQLACCIYDVERRGNLTKVKKSKQKNKKQKKKKTKRKNPANMFSRS